MKTLMTSILLFGILTTATLVYDGEIICLPLLVALTSILFIINQKQKV